MIGNILQAGPFCEKNLGFRIPGSQTKRLTNYKLQGLH